MIMKNRSPSNEQISRMIQLSTALGVIKKSSEGFAPLKLAYFPYSTSSNTYERVQAITKVWQKLLFKASRDFKTIERVYKEIQHSDPMVSNLMRIFRLKKSHNDDSLTFVRTDYFLNEAQEPKIIEYNLLSVSMSSHSQNFQQAKKLSDPTNKSRYIDSKPNSAFANGIIQLYARKKLNGVFLFIVSETQTNLIEQRLLQIKLLEAGINVVRMTLLEANNQLHLDESGRLFYGAEEISVVYYRAGYQLTDYQSNPKATWHAREIIELSRAQKIPSITFDLMNQKRMQVQLSKESVYSQFLSEEEGKLLKTSLVPVWQFDNISQSQFNIFLETLEREGGEYVLKPNLEGGGNNIYGEEALAKLKSLDADERKKYILMAKIVTIPCQNLLINGQNHVKAKCICQVSQYGTIAVDEGTLISSETCGFLIRAKPEEVNEGGIMAGVGSICSWILQ